MPRLKIVATFAILISTLACRAATSLIFPDTPTPAPPPTRTSVPDTPVPSPPPPTPTVTFEAACPILLTDIMDAGTNPTGNTEGNSTALYFVNYTIVDDKLTSRKEIQNTNKINTEQDAQATHEFIWDYFAALIPQEERDFVTGFSISSDGKGEILAAVNQNHTNPAEWTLEVDILDSDDMYNLTFTLLHEFGHLLTLNSRQVSVNRRLFFSPGNDDLYQQAVAECPQYFPGEGCSNPDSYINEFFNRFWKDLYEEWQGIDLIEDDDTYYEALDIFYYEYQDQFLTDYAPTNPAEDIAESWAFFLLSPRPLPDSIANEKILFFYNYPELVKLREDILDRVCEAFPQ